MTSDCQPSLRALLRESAECSGQAARSLVAASAAMQAVVASVAAMQADMEAGTNALLLSEAVLNRAADALDASEE